MRRQLEEFTREDEDLTLNLVDNRDKTEDVEDPCEMTLQVTKMAATLIKYRHNQKL